MVFGLVSAVFGQVMAKTSVKRMSHRGWGETYRWVSLEDGYRLSAKQNLPLMVIVHKLTCMECRSFKKKFAQSELVQDLSENFVLVNLDTTEVPSETNMYIPDGNYYPRILFFTPRGYLMSDVTNPYRKDKRFTYSDPAFLADAMRNALKTMR